MPASLHSDSHYITVSYASSVFQSAISSYGLTTLVLGHSELLLVLEFQQFVLGSRAYKVTESVPTH